MQSLKPPFNPELMEILNQFIEDISQHDLSQIKYHNVENARQWWNLPLREDDGYYYSSEEHLDYMKNEKDYKLHPNDDGFAEATMGINMITPGPNVPDAIKQIVYKVNSKLNAYFCSKFSAVNMYYPKGGFMGWHNNNNCPGWNILMSYTNGDHEGYFMYQEPGTGEFIKLEDNQNIMNGWTIKVGYFGGKDEPDRIFWHTARVYDNERLTLAYVIPDEHKEFWDMMVEDIQDA